MSLGAIPSGSGLLATPLLPLVVSEVVGTVLCPAATGVAATDDCVETTCTAGNGVLVRIKGVAVITIGVAVAGSEWILGKTNVCTLLKMLGSTSSPAILTELDSASISVLDVIIAVAV